MRKYAVLLALVLLSLGAPALANPVAQGLIYSQEANSGVRHEVCTTLDGTTVDSYYTGDYTFDGLSTLSSDELLQTLRTLMVSTHSYQTS